MKEAAAELLAELNASVPKHFVCGSSSVENRHAVECWCGWWSPSGDVIDVAQAFGDHIAEVGAG